MNFPAKPQFGLLLILAAASSALFAQNNEQAKYPKPPRVLDAREIASISLAASERSWQERGRLAYTERDDDRRLDSTGKVESENIDVTRMDLVHGARFERLMEHNGQPPSDSQQRKNDESLDRLKHETPAQQAVRVGDDQENMSTLRDLFEAFDFQLLGEEMIGGRPAYVLQATPHPGYRAHGKYAKILGKVEGKLWIDKQDFGLVKAEGDVTQPISMGFFVARIEGGSHLILEQTCVGDAVWVPERVEMRASARILFLKSLDMDRILTYFDYRPAAGGAYSVSR